MTAGSLLGDFGARAEQSAWDLLSSGLVAIIATDAHDTVRRPPRFFSAVQSIERRLGFDVARRVCWEGPARVVERSVGKATGWGRRSHVFN